MSDKEFEEPSTSGAEGIIDKIKGLYYPVEDKYYALLDRINEHIPVYKIIDPIDEIVPSLLLFTSLMLLFVIGVILLLLLIPQPLKANFKVVDDAGNIVPDIEIAVAYDGKSEIVTADEFGEFSLMMLNKNVTIDIDEEGYEPYSETIEAKFDEENIIELTELAPEFEVKIVKIMSEDGSIIRNGVSLTFACSDGGTPPNSITNSDGDEEVAVFADCGTATATAMHNDYHENSEPLIATTTIITLSPKAPPTGTLNVIVKDIETNDPLAGKRVKLYSSGSPPRLINECNTDSSGMCSFNVQPGSYFARAEDSQGIYAVEESSTVTVTTGDSETITMYLSKVVGDGVKVMLKFVDIDTANTISNVEASLYEESLFLTRTNSSSDGIAEFRNLDENKSYTVIATHPNYLLKVNVDVPLINTNDSNATVIYLVPITEIPPNYGDAIVEVYSLAGESVESADVYLFITDHDFYIDFGATASDGTITFENLPAGSYYATANSFGAEGTSPTVDLNLGGTIVLPITLVLQEGSLAVTVIDMDGNPIEGATVKFYDSITTELLDDAETDADGETEEVSFLWDKKPYLVVTKAGYYPLITGAFDLAPETTIDVTVVLEPEGTYSQLEIELDTVYKDDGETVATRLSDDETYFFKFRMVVPEGSIQDVEAVVRTGLQENLYASDSLIVIKGSTVPFGSIGKVYSACYDETDDFLDCSPTSPYLGAKQIRLDFGELSMAIYEFKVEVYIKETEESDALIEVRYGAIAEGGSIRRPEIDLYETNLYLWSVRLGEIIECDPGEPNCPNFLFLFTLSDDDSELKDPDVSGTIALDPETGHDLMQDVNYTLGYVVWNRDKDGEDFYDISLSFIDILDTQALLVNDQLPPYTISIPTFEQGTDVGGSVRLDAVTDAAAVELVADLSVEKPDHNITINFSVLAKNDVLAKNEFEVSWTPDALTAGTSNNLTVRVKDSDSGALIEAATVTMDEDPFFLSPILPIQETNIHGYVSAYIEQIFSTGQQLWLKVEMAGYQPWIGYVDVVEGFFPSSRPDFNCLTVEPVELSMLFTEYREFTITTSECLEPVDLQLDDRAADDGIELQYDDGGSWVNIDKGTTTLSLDTDDFVDIRVRNPEHLGEYGVFIQGKFESDSPDEYADLNRVRVYVNPLGSSIHCFVMNPDKADNEKYFYDIFHKIANGTITNRCFVYIEDEEMPALGVYSNESNIPNNPHDKLGIYLSEARLHQEVEKFRNFAGQELTTIDINTMTAGNFVEVIEVDVEMTDEMHWNDPDSAATPYLDRTTEGDMHLVSVEEKLGDSSQWIAVSQGYPDLADRPNWVDTEGSDILWQGLHNYGSHYPVNKEARKIRVESNGGNTKIYTVAWRYIRTDPNNNGIIDFNIINRTLAGEEYALITVEDYVSGDGAVGPTITFNYNLVAEAKQGEESTERLDLIPDYELPGQRMLVISMDETKSPRVRDYALDGWSLAVDELGNTYLDVKAFGMDLNANDPEGFNGEVWVHRDDVGWFMVESAEKYGEPETAEGTDYIDVNEAQLGYQLITIDMIAFRNLAPSDQNILTFRFIDLNTVDTTLLRASEEQEATIDTDGTIQEILTDYPIPDTVFYSLPNYISGLPLLDKKYIIENDNPNITVFFIDTGGTETTVQPVDVNAQYLVTAIVPQGSEIFHVRLKAGEENECFGDSELVGGSGESAKPRIMLSWNWDNLSLNESIGPCDFDNPDYIYCDATQFSMELIKKLLTVMDMTTDLNYENIAQTPPYLHFSSYLIRDGYTVDFRNDFNKFVTTALFFATPADYVGSQGFYKYFTNPDKLVFEAPDPYSTDPLDISGLYKIDVDINFEIGSEWVFFDENDEPNAKITVRMEPIEEVRSSNPFYYLPFDGELGLEGEEYHRVGYGIDYSGDMIYIVRGENLIEDETVKTYLPAGGSDALFDVGINEIGNTGDTEADFITLNKDERGYTLSIDKEGTFNYTINYAPSYATPLAMMVEGELGEAYAFYYLIDAQENVINTGQSASFWTGIASSLDPICTTFDGTPLFYYAPDAVPVPDRSCSITEIATSSYGFGWKPASTGIIFLRTIFYTPKNTIHLTNACLDVDAMYISPNWALVFEGGFLGDVTEIPLDYENKPLSINEIIEYVVDEKMCLSTVPGRTETWWHTNYLYEKLEEGYWSTFDLLKERIPEFQECDVAGTIE